MEKKFFHLFSARRTCTLLHMLSASGLVRLAEKCFFHLFPAGFEAKSIFLPFFPHTMAEKYEIAIIYYKEIYDKIKKIFFVHVFGYNFYNN